MSVFQVFYESPQLNQKALKEKRFQFNKENKLKKSQLSLAKRK